MGIDLCGYEGIIYGGFFVMMLDEGLVWCFFLVLFFNVGMIVKFEINYKVFVMVN